LEDVSERAEARPASSAGLPMLTASASGTVLYMNEAFRRLAGGRVKALDRIFDDLPLVSGRIYEIAGPDGPVSCLVARIEGTGGRQEIYLLPASTVEERRPRPAEWDAIEDLPVPLLKVAASGEVLAANREARELLRHDMPPGTRLS